MPPKRTTAVAVGKTLEERRDTAREAALKEIKALRADLATLEAVLSGRRKKTDISLFDLTHGALEIFRYASAVFESEELLGEYAQEIEMVKALDYLEKHGATELVKPSGWHWISPKGEMHFLGKAEDPAKAAARLAELLPGNRRSRRRAKDTSDAPDKVGETVPVAPPAPSAPDADEA